MASDNDNRRLSGVIDQILSIKDPSVVGLRRILRKKQDASMDFPLKSQNFEDFSAADETGTATAVFTEDEKQVIDLEKKIINLQAQLADQRKKAELAMQAAYQKGLEEGKNVGIGEGKASEESGYNQKVAELEKKFAATANEISAGAHQSILTSHKQLLDTAFILAKKIIHTEVTLNPDVVLGVVKAAIAHIADHEKLIIRVAPQDVETVSGKRSLWADISEKLEGIRIEADDRIEQGGCIVESASGIADARISVMVNELHDVIDLAWRDNMAGAHVPSPEAP
jgi:flagellar assembly protein FliH